MNNIPSEILQKIFLLLHQHDKAVCMTVCRLWKHALENAILFDTVYLYNKQQFNDFISKKRQEPNQREKIGRLIIDMKDMEDIKLDDLPLVIPSLRELYFYENNYAHNLLFTKPFFPHSWSNTIRKINEKSSNTFTAHILKCGVCPNLAQISVHGESVKLGKAFIRLLVNAPMLKSLSFKSYNVSLEDIESLHKATPLLSSFVLSYGTVECATLPTGIRPMLHMRKLTLEHVNVATSAAYIILQRYLTVKYPMVNELVHRITVDSRIDVARSFKTGFDLQIKQIGSHLTSLKISNNNNCFKYIIPILDKNNCRVKKLGMVSSLEASEIKRIVTSTQAQCIQSLSLYHIYYGSFTNYIEALPLLTELNLHCTIRSIRQGRVKIIISQLLKNIGNTLVRLRVYQAEIKFYRLAVPEYLSLRYLILQKVTMSSHADHFISQSFPNLHTLKMDDTNWAESTLYFGNLKLAYLELRCVIPSTNSYVELVTLSNNNKRWYTTTPVSTHRRRCRADPNTFPVVKSYPFDKSNDLPHMTVVCASVYNFFLVNLHDSY